MDQIVTVFLQVVAVIILVIFGSFAWISHREREARAVRLSLVIGLAGVGLFLSLAAAPQPIPWISFGLVVVAGIGFNILFLLPIGSHRPGKRDNNGY